MKPTTPTLICSAALLFSAAWSHASTTAPLDGFHLGQNTPAKATADKKEAASFKVLVFSKTQGFRHDAIPEGIAALRKLGQANHFEVTATEDGAEFTDEKLAPYQLVVFLNTTGDVLDDTQQAAFEKYLAKGRGFMGVHSATDTEYGWKWYGQMIGGYFAGHPQIQPATLQVVNRKHPATAHLPESWKRTDEWYNFKNLQEDNKVLIKLDEKSYEGGKNGDNHPTAWYKEFGGGRVFYTGGGHTKESYKNEDFLKHLQGGLLYAAGKAKDTVSLDSQPWRPEDTRPSFAEALAMAERGRSSPMAACGHEACEDAAAK